MGPTATPPAERSRTATAPAHHPLAGRGFWWAGLTSLLLVAGSAVAAVALPDRAALLTVRLAMIFCLLLGGLTCVVTGLRRHGAERAWRLLVSVLVLAIFAGAVAMFPEMAAGGPPVPPQGAASLAYLVPQAFGLAGVLSYPSDPFDLILREPGRGRDRRWYVITILDGMIMVGAAVLLVWVAVLEDALEERSPLANGPIYSILLAATILVVMVGVILMAVFRQPRAGSGLGLLILGLLAVSASIMWYTSVVVRGLRDVPRLVDVLQLTGPLLIGLAALAPDTSQPTRPAGAEADSRVVAPRRRWWHAVLPYLPLTAAAIVTLIEISGENLSHSEELWALLALLLLALIRQMTTMADNIRLLGKVEEKQRLLRYQAFHDPLTGLANRALFTDRLDRALRHTGQLAVLFCDLDDFKSVNDTYGHAAGDDLLRVTARRLTNCVRQTDTVARLGGDEFAILLHADTQNPETVGRRITASLRSPIRLGRATCTVAASTGLVVIEPAREPVTVEALLHRADLAMYAAKTRRTGDLTTYTPDLAAPRISPAGNATPATTPREDTARGHLPVACRPVIAYRPVIDLATGSPVAYEARLAGPHPGSGAPRSLLTDGLPALGQIPPDATDTTDRLDATGDPGHPLPIHITISADDAGQATLVEDVTTALRTAHLAPADLVLQIRPTRRSVDLTALTRLHSTGVRIGLAELGAPDNTFDATIDTLGRAPVELVTLHPDLTARWTAPRHSSPAVALTHDVLAALLGPGITVIADGVNHNHPATIRRLREHGCHLALGDSLDLDLPPRRTRPARERPAD
ncbi:GGDEF domain-containing protein [Parafrankia elaeagni]|uniref:GGDEF domain-containing protein n=1 Tax=Parafrankia elaeagni TaxID=222534 RepID=UPI00055337E9|nr:diguanylate cyclase [Parafrankia elaeagni]